MKKAIAVLLILFAAVWSTLTYPRVGQVVYNANIAAEAALYGFDKQPVDIGEMTMSVYTGGTEGKPAILMLHGYSADKDVWLRFARHFTDDYRVIIPDMAGHGETPFDPAWSYTMKSQAGRLTQLLDKLGIERVHIIGNSMGGFISARFASDYPERTLSATLVDPAGVESPEPSDMLRMLAQGRNPFVIHNIEEFREFYPMTMASPPWMPGFVLDALGEGYRLRREQLAQIFDDIQASETLDGQLDKIQAPVLLLWGKDDRLIHVSSVDVWQAGIPNIEVQVWDHIGHMPMLEIPSESAARYREFLEQLPATVSAL